MGACCGKNNGTAPSVSVKFTCFDCCCGGTKEKSKFSKLAADVIYFILLYNQQAIDSLVYIQAIFFGVWQMLALVPGFALYNGAVNGPANAITHFGWWSLIEFVVIALGIRCTMFQLSIPGNVNKLEFPARQATEFNQFYLFMLIVGFISNGVQLGLTINELAYGSGQLASTYLGFGIYFCCQIGAVAFFLYPWIAFRVWVYSQHLKLACADKVLLFDATPVFKPDVLLPEEEEEQQQTKEEEPPATQQEEETPQEVNVLDVPKPQPAPGAAAASQIGSSSSSRFNGVITPLMAQAYSRKNK
jgi:hypothetical protein